MNIEISPRVWYVCTDGKRWMIKANSIRIERGKLGFLKENEVFPFVLFNRWDYFFESFGDDPLVESVKAEDFYISEILGNG